LTLATLLLLTPSSAYMLEDDLTEDLTVTLDRWASRKLRRVYGERVEDANEDFERHFRDMGRHGHDGPRDHHLLEMAEAEAKEYGPEYGNDYHGDMHGDMHHHMMEPRRDAHAMLEYADHLAKEEFGWGLEEKYNQIKPE